MTMCTRGQTRFMQANDWSVEPGRLRAENCRHFARNVSACALTISLLFAIAGCRGERAAAEPPPATPDQIKELVAALTSKQTDTGMGLSLIHI